MKFKSFKRALLGLDFSPKGLFLARIKKNKAKNNILIHDLLQSPLPPTLFLGSEMLDWTGFTTTLAPLVQKYRLKDYPVAICLPAERVSLQNHTFPCDLPDKDIQMAIESHIAREFPGMQNAFSFDYTLLPKRDPLYMEAVVTITRKDYLNQYVQAVTRAGLKVSVVDVDIYASLRTLLSTQHFPVEDMNAALLIEQADATLMLFSQERIIFYERIHLHAAHEQLTYEKPTYEKQWLGLLQKLNFIIPMHTEKNMETIFIHAEEENFREYITKHSPNPFHYYFSNEVTPHFHRALGLALWGKTNKGHTHAHD